MTKLAACLLLFACIISCKKDNKSSRYDVQFQVSFKLDGQQYSTVLRQDEMNGYTASGTTGANGVTTFTLGPNFKVGNTGEISFAFGNYHSVPNDLPGNMARMKYLLRPGNKNYACIHNYCDTALADAVQVSYTEDKSGLMFWHTTKLTKTAGNLVTAIVDQPGSHFTITEIKESTRDGVNTDAVIIKGTFNCIVYKSTTGEKKTITDGRFTCLVPVL